MKTFITGKDAALEDSIEHFQAQLTKYNLNVKEVAWINPVPNVWSVHLQSLDCPLCFSNGKGACKKSALASALGEYFERLSTNYFFSDFYLGEQNANQVFVHYPSEKWITPTKNWKKSLLTPSLWRFYDSEQELQFEDLIDLQSSNPERGICALPFVQQSNQETVYVPVNLISNLYASNGMAAGNTQTEAQVQALSEIFERYVKNKIIAEAIALPLIPESVLAKYPSVLESIQTLEEAGFPICCFDASLGGKYPVICVTLFNPDNGGCFASFGAHPNLGVALERTVTELLQGRSLNQLDGFAAPSFDTDEVADLSNLETHFIDSSGLISWDLFRSKPHYHFVPWDFSGTTQSELQTLLSICAKQKIEVLIMNYAHLGVCACRILAVGLSEIYPPEDLLIANSNMAISLRSTILSLPTQKHHKRHYLNLIDKLYDLGLDDSARVRELLGLATGDNNAWFTLRIGELKAMLALAGQDLETANLWIDWTLDMNQSTFNPERLRAYRCLQTLVQFRLERDIADFPLYRMAFCKMFGDKMVEQMWQVALGKSKFFGLFAVDPDLNAFPMHQDLLKMYQKVHLAMSQA